MIYFGEFVAITVKGKGTVPPYMNLENSKDECRLNTRLMYSWGAIGSNSGSSNVQLWCNNDILYVQNTHRSENLNTSWGGCLITKRQ